MGNSSGNFKSNVDSVDIELDFEIDPNRGQSELRKFGYYFNKKGQCRSIDTDERVGRFPSQKEYEAFGAALEEFIFFLLRDQYKMTEHIIGSKSAENADSDKADAATQSAVDSNAVNEEKADQQLDADKADEPKGGDSAATSTSTKRQNAKRKSRPDDDLVAKSRIYLSPNYGTKKTLLLLIPGSGAVRAGQWARSICINDNLAAGCMYPYIAEAFQRDWG